jgi:hypothetical protein
LSSINTADVITIAIIIITNHQYVSLFDPQTPLMTSKPDPKHTHMSTVPNAVNFDKTSLI